MVVNYNVGDRIEGSRILCEARKIDKPKPIPKSGRHKTQRTVLRVNAEATILTKIKYIGDST